MRRVLTGVSTAVSVLTAVGVAALPASAGRVHDPLVSVGSPVSPFSANKQNEPALAVDQHHPTPAGP